MKIKLSIYSIRWRICFLLVTLLCSVNVMAQQEPLYTQYMFNTMSVNPGYTGTRNALNATLLTRKQWAGFKGAPQTNAFSVHTPVNNYRIGLGISVVDDSYGPVDKNYISLNYAYRIKVSESLILSMGIRAGIYNYQVKLSELSVENPDNAFGFNYEKKVQPNAGAGIYLYSKRYYAGFAVPILAENYISKEIQGVVNPGEMKRHYYLMGGYVFDVSKDLKFKPSFIGKLVEGAPLSVDVTGQFLLKDRFWLGASYRFDDAVALIANFQINRQLMVGYSYDMSVSKLKSFNNGSHEIMISFDFDGFIKRKVKSPRYF
ncbi:type IX secretion system membrane protein PorP/SprF [Puteibacter caeruleilacunae]|nr:type IX secretion system membrane protein PorP/SprF [Puteibacter caeruleilacunae]